MELSDYERSVLTELEADFASGARASRLRALRALRSAFRLRAWGSAFRLHATRWWKPVTVSVVAGLLCLLAAVTCRPNAAAVIIGLIALGLGVVWGLALHTTCHKRC